jgi:transposase
MVGAVGAAARGAMEVGERDGVQPQADLAGVQGVVWDHAAFPKAKALRVKGVHLPPYSPELNPAEQVFAEVRGWVEGRQYERTEAKKAAGEGVPRWLEAEAKVSSLVGWRCIRQALHALPS